MKSRQATFLNLMSNLTWCLMIQLRNDDFKRLFVLPYKIRRTSEMKTSKKLFYTRQLKKVARGKTGFHGPVK